MGVATRFEDQLAIIETHPFYSISDGTLRSNEHIQPKAVTHNLNGDGIALLFAGY